MITPIVFITILCSEDIVRLLFKGYHFDQVSVKMTSICLAIHIIGLIPIFIAKMQQILLFSFKNTRIPLEAALVAMVSNIIIASVVSSYIWRHPGSIALAGTFSTLMMVFYFNFRLFFSRHNFSNRGSNKLSEIKIFRGDYKDFFINLLYSLIIAGLVYQFSIFNFVSQLSQQLIKIAFFQDFLSFLIKALLFGVPYYFISRYFKHTEYLVFLKILKKRQ